MASFHAIQSSHSKLKTSCPHWIIIFTVFICLEMSLVFIEEFYLFQNKGSDWADLHQPPGWGVQMVSIWFQLETAKLFLFSPLCGQEVLGLLLRELNLQCCMSQNPHSEAWHPYYSFQMHDYKNWTFLHLAATYKLMDEAKYSISILAEGRCLFKPVVPQSITEQEDSLDQWFSKLRSIRGTWKSR